METNFDLVVKNGTIISAGATFRGDVGVRGSRIAAIGEELIGEGLSQPFTVDNTPPEVTALEARGEPGAATRNPESRNGGIKGS